MIFWKLTHRKTLASTQTPLASIGSHWLAESWLWECNGPCRVNLFFPLCVLVRIRVGGRVHCRHFHWKSHVNSRIPLVSLSAWCHICMRDLTWTISSVRASDQFHPLSLAEFPHWLPLVYANTPQLQCCNCIQHLTPKRQDLWVRTVSFS